MPPLDPTILRRSHPLNMGNAAAGCDTSSYSSPPAIVPLFWLVALILAGEG